MDFHISPPTETEVNKTDEFSITTREGLKFSGVIQDITLFKDRENIEGPDNYVYQLEFIDKTSENRYRVTFHSDTTLLAKLGTVNNSEVVGETKQLSDYSLYIF